MCAKQYLRYNFISVRKFSQNYQEGNTNKQKPAPGRTGANNITARQRDKTCAPGRHAREKNVQDDVEAMSATRENDNIFRRPVAAGFDLHALPEILYLHTTL